MTIQIQDVLLDSTTTFDTWRVRTNEIAAAMRNNVVTVGGDPAVGDAIIDGSLEATNIYATNLYGGQISAVGTITVNSNTIFQAQIDAVDIFLSGSLSLLNNTKLIVPGATTSAKHLEFDPNTNTPIFVHVPRFQDTTRTNGSILVWNSTNNQYEHNDMLIVDVGNNIITTSVKISVPSIDVSGPVNISTGSRIITLGGADFIHNSYASGTIDTNIFIGENAGNTTVGQGYTNSWEGTKNIGIGNYSLNSITLGFYNVAVGYGACSSMTTGKYNISIGMDSLATETTGSNNIAIGTRSLRYQNGGNDNTSIGYYSGYDITTGSGNTLFGSNSGRGIITGTNNTFIGANINLGDVSNNIAFSTGDGTVRARFDGLQWNIPEKVVWLSHGNAELRFDVDGGSGGPLKRITIDDGNGNLNIRSGCYYNTTNARLEYSTASQAAACIQIENENTNNSEINIRTFAPNATGIAGEAVSGEKSLIIRSNQSYPVFSDGSVESAIWHQNDIGNRIAALIENTAPAGTEFVVCSDGKKVSISNIIGHERSLNTTGYLRLNNGLLIQWGYTNAQQTVTFPIAFNTVFICITELDWDGTPWAHTSIGYFTNTSFYARVSWETYEYDSPISWLAIGI